MRTYYLALLLTLMVSSCSEPSIPAEISTILEQVKANYAPDKRVALWDVEASQDQGRVILRGETNMEEALNSLKEQLAGTAVEVEYDIEILPDTSLGGKHFGIVNLSACNIRSQPRHSAELATQATLGTILKVYKEVNGWYLVQTPDHYLGWLDADGFTLGNEAMADNWKKQEKIVFLPDFGFSYQSPAVNAAKVSDLLAGNILLFSHTTEGFALVEYPDGRTAYIPQEQTASYADWLSRPIPDATHILNTANTFIGRPYLWGGTSGKGVDCSGFTKTVFYLNGILLPRDASQQVNVGELIDTENGLDQLQAGDLMFFGRKANAQQKEKITHVAIYMGNEHIIHSAGQVKVESLNPADSTYNEYRMETFVKAKRVLPVKPEFGVFPLTAVEAYQ
jgi:cell wall-associated NlpC family hydrolase